MKVFNIFSKREKERRGELPDVYQYETIPEALRNQVISIWEDVFGKPVPQMMGGLSYSKVYETIHDILCREHGIRTLKKYNDYYFDAICNYFLETEDTDKVIDVIDVSFQIIDQYVRNYPAQFHNAELSPDEAIAELNHRCRRHGVGYRYESGQIIRIDSEFIHSEVVKPALKMLSDPMYEGANDEFLKAHDHYQAQRYEECMNECLKAFESCIKAICDKRGWSYGEQDGLKRLIDIVFGENLIPSPMQSYFSGLRATLESGASTLRNRHSGHGQGSTIITVPEYLTAYVLHSTASNALFLAKADEEMK